MAYGIGGVNGKLYATDNTSHEIYELNPDNMKINKRWSSPSTSPTSIDGLN